MKTGQVLGTVVAVLLVGGVALYAQRGGSPDMKPGGAPDMQNGASQPMPPPGMPDMRAGGPADGRMVGHGGPHGCRAMMPDPAGMLKAGASEQQVQALDEFAFEQQVKRIDLNAAAEKADLTVEHLMRASSLDEKAVGQAVDTLTQARGELFKLDIASRIKVRQVLGEDILRKLREQCPPDRMERRGTGPVDQHRGDGPDAGRPEAAPKDAGICPPPEHAE